MSVSEVKIRQIEPADNEQVKKLVLTTLGEFGLFGEGYAGVDPELNDMYASYNNELSAYFVVEYKGEISGVAGYAPLAGTQIGSVAELRKMYLNPSLRGKQVGYQLIQKCINEAIKKGYCKMYLETVPEMKAAQALYVKNGFSYLKQRMGDTGHNNCGVCMVRKLND